MDTHRSPKIEYLLSHKLSPAFSQMYSDEVLLHANATRTTFLGEKTNKVCRFCKRNSNETTFKMDAHVFPEFMGNRHLLSHFECDQCNVLFSRYETSFSNFFQINHT